MSASDTPASRFHLARRSVGIGLTSLRDYGIVVSFIVIFLFLTFKSDVFLSKVNLFNVLDGNSSDGIMAVGGTLVLIAGGFDLSVGAIFALSGVIAPERIFINVDLPAPFSPHTASTWPRPAEKLISRSAWVPSKLLLTPLTLSLAVITAGPCQ